MEIITLFGVVCLVLIVVSGVVKQMKAKKLADTISRIKKAITEDGVSDLATSFQRELDEVARVVGRIESKAILDHMVVKEFIRLLPAECYKASLQRRRELIADAMIRFWSPQPCSMPSLLPSWEEPQTISLPATKKSQSIKQSILSGALNVSSEQQVPDSKLLEEKDASKRPREPICRYEEYLINKVDYSDTKMNYCDNARLNFVGIVGVDLYLYGVSANLTRRRPTNLMANKGVKAVQTSV